MGDTNPKIEEDLKDAIDEYGDVQDKKRKENNEKCGKSETSDRLYGSQPEPVDCRTSNNNEQNEEMSNSWVWVKNTLDTYIVVSHDGSEAKEIPTKLIIMGLVTAAFLGIARQFGWICRVLALMGTGYYWKKPEEPVKNRICIVSRNEKFLDSVTSEVEELAEKVHLEVEIYKQLTKRSPQDMCSDEYFSNASMVIFVAVSEPRLLLISDKEESQLGNLYCQAEKLKVSAFLLLVGHCDSDDLADTELYHPSLRAICKSQPQIGELANTKCFISTGFLYNPHDLSFQDNQRNAIKRWINNNITTKTAL